MFGIGFWELVLIFVIALIIFGPEKLPKIATSLGKAYYEFRKTMESVKFDIEEEVKNLDEEIEKEANNMESELQNPEGSGENERGEESGAGGREEEG